MTETNESLKRDAARKVLAWRAHFPEGEPKIGIWHDYAEDKGRMNGLEEEGCTIEYAYAHEKEQGEL